MAIGSSNARARQSSLAPRDHEGGSAQQAGEADAAGRQPQRDGTASTLEPKQAAGDEREDSAEREHHQAGDAERRRAALLHLGDPWWRR